MRGATDAVKGGGEVKKFQPTRPLRGATRIAPRTASTSSKIVVFASLNFNPRAPCGARPAPPVTGAINILYFNPRAPCGARLLLPPLRLRLFHFNPRAPCGARHMQYQACETYEHFNPRAPCGARRRRVHILHVTSYFNPRAPCGARRIISLFQTALFISTHAPLAGRDRCTRGIMIPNQDFNPRAPCGARPHELVGQYFTEVFQPTRPLRGATAVQICCHRHIAISTHAPLAGRDKNRCNATDRYKISTHAPLAGRDKRVSEPIHNSSISTHAPLAGRDGACCDRRLSTIANFNPRAPCGARHAAETRVPEAFHFNPRAPCGARRARGENGRCSL